MSSEPAVQVQGLSKCYHIYEQPRDRLKQMVVPRLQGALGRARHHYYREFWALRDVSLAIGKGETVGIIGQNGSGKSTLLQLICRTLEPTAGTLATHGRIAALLELGAGFNPEFTGRENAILNSVILGVPKEVTLARLDEIIRFSELGDFFDQPVKTYSSGMAARLGFSVAIHVDPAVLIVDEALAVGDARFVAKCMRKVKDIQANGSTIIFVSHDVSSVRTLCQRAFWLDKGRLVDEGDVFPVTGRYMAFMMRDDKASDDAVRDEVAQPVPAPAEPASAGAPVTPARLDSRPVTHWGSHKGVILGASVCGSHGRREDVVQWGEPIEVVIDLSVPPEISREHLSVAFSIKDLKGTDLIASTTHDMGAIRLPEQANFQVRFKLPNWLVTGKYVLVAALEDRQHRDIHYYEYFEGAHYFASLTDQRFFGVVQPAIEQTVHLT